MSVQRARWGFHELDNRYARQLVASAGIQPGELVLDLGAGHGAIAAHLLAQRARVVAVELHPARAARLRSRFAGEALRVVECDLTDWKPPTQPYRVVANPPFAVLATVLRRLTVRDSQLIAADLVVPAHVALRWARGGGYTRRYRGVVVCRLPTTAFRPPATQPVCVLRLTRSAVTP